MVKRKMREPLAFKNPNRSWVVAELRKLYGEWKSWSLKVGEIEDHPYNKNTEAECFADGRENMHTHRILQTRTLTFLDNNIQGHDFMLSNQYEEPYEDIMGRLKSKVPYRVQELEVLMASLEYALVPDSFWKEQGKKMVENLATVAPEKAADTAASWLRNPLSFK